MAKKQKKFQKLTPKQERFCLEYPLDFNATQAAIRAGYSRRTARVMGQQNLLKPAIRKKIEAVKAETAKRARITLDEVITELNKIAKVTMRDCLDRSRKGFVFRHVRDIPPDCMDCIAEVAELPGGRVKVKFYNKLAALQTLLQYFVDSPGQGENTTRIIRSPLAIRPGAA